MTSLQKWASDPPPPLLVTLCHFCLPPPPPLTSLSVTFYNSKYFPSQNNGQQFFSSPNFFPTVPYKKRSTMTFSLKIPSFPQNFGACIPTFFGALRAQIPLLFVTFADPPPPPSVTFADPPKKVTSFMNGP